jgi:non-specific serine/threonine protein kinase/serine/threonine-protein kinase
MTPPRREEWARVRQIFEAALAQPVDRRSSFIAASCPGAPAIGEQVMGLLASHDQAAAFLERPAVHEIADLPLAGAEAAPGADANVGRTIGPYVLESCLGHGGMGTVYLARRADHAFERRVALKMVRGDMNSDVVVRRFEHERQILASLDHPHVARLYDGGTTPEGLPYFVMEYVEGEPITHYCTRRGLDTRARLAMFRTVCGAVQYAHQRLVVHRDLKPGNILVGADGQPKLLDFGIARLLAGAGVHESPGATLVSALTPDYASPEQVRGQTVTTATDVYSLGVILYELLAGRRPFAIRASSLEDIVRTVCETDPLPPSAAIDGAGDSGRPCPPHELRGDVDTIVLRALRKEPERRYRSAQELSDDIGRFLEGRAVLARGDARAYRAAKFVARHWTAVLVAAVVLVSLVGGLVLVVRQKQIADEQRRRAERRFADVRKLAGSFLFEVQDTIQDLPGAIRARELVTRRAVEYLDGLAVEAGDDPTLQAELARAYQRVGDVLGNGREANLGDAAGALASYRQALRLQTVLADAQPLDGTRQRDVAETLRRIGDVQLKTRESDAALASFRRAQAIAATLVARAAGDRGAGVALASAHYGIADAVRQLGDRSGAIEHLTRTIAILDGQAAQPGDLEARRLAARARKRLGSLHGELGDTARSLALQLEALRLSEALAAEHPRNQSVRNDVAMSHVDLGRAHLGHDRLAEALRSYRRAEAITRSIVEADPGDAQARWLNGLELNAIGFVLTHMGREPEAVASHTQALALLDALARAEPQNQTYQYNLANTHQLIGDAHASAAGPSSSHAVEGWRTACTWYRKSDRLFDAMRRRGTLTVAFAADAEHVAARLARCEASPR